MFDDPILEELYAVRAEMLAEFGGDWRVMLRDIHRGQEVAQASGVVYLRVPSRPVEAATKGSPAESPAMTRD